MTMGQFEIWTYMVCIWICLMLFLKEFGPIDDTDSEP